MATSKHLASKLNGSKSKGPVSAAGKQISSKNAQKHGILSRELILPGEREEEFQALLGQLQSELRPLGTLENTIVERIAIAIWRQRRLVRAETAKTQLRQLKQHELQADSRFGTLGIKMIHIDAGVPRKELGGNTTSQNQNSEEFSRQADKENHHALYFEANLFPNDADQMSRYQSALDNELYKAMRALREAQGWRMQSIDIQQTPD